MRRAHYLPTNKTIYWFVLIVDIITKICHLYEFLSHVSMTQLCRVQYRYSNSVRLSSCLSFCLLLAEVALKQHSLSLEPNRSWWNSDIVISDLDAKYRCEIAILIIIIMMSTMTGMFTVSKMSFWTRDLSTARGHGPWTSLCVTMLINLNLKI